jgi:HAD superfamily hydrolase (TIGR01509 family)
MPRFAALLFDCDGVLVDSEPITHRVLQHALSDLGWALSLEECELHFMGRAVKDQRELIWRETGRHIDEAWLTDFRLARDEALKRELRAIEHAPEVVKELNVHYEHRMACVSGADRGKVEMQLKQVGLWDYFEGRIFSGHEVPNTKPAPDVYLAALSCLEQNPQQCLAIEDTPSGVRSASLAGLTVWAFLKDGLEHGVCTADQLERAGAQRVLGSLAELRSGCL